MTRTPEQARAWLESHGVSQAEFAAYHQLSRMALSDIFRGKVRGKRGEAHRAMVLLGIKPAPQGQPPLPEPLARPAPRKPRAGAPSEAARHG